MQQHTYGKDSRLLAAVTGSRFGSVNPASRVVYPVVMAAGIVGLTSIPTLLDS